jgi:hypothetical protein
MCGARQVPTCRGSISSCAHSGREGLLSTIPGVPLGFARALPQAIRLSPLGSTPLWGGQGRVLAIPSNRFMTCVVSFASRGTV